MPDKSAFSDLVNDIVSVSQKLGRVPTRDEYLSHPEHRFSKHSLLLIAGSYTVALQATGLSYTKQGSRNKEEIRRRAFEHLQEEITGIKSKVAPPPLVKNLIVIPDLHSPSMHPQAYDFVKSVVDKYGYDYAACTGDEVDGSSWSFHDADPDDLSPGHELDAAIRKLKPFYELFPKLAIAHSNHGDLVFRKQRHHGLPARVIKSYREVLDAPEGWEWSFEIRLQLSNGKPLLIHHSYSSNVLRSSQQRGMSCIFGHHHSKFSIEYWRNYDDMYFGAFAGCLVDETALAMAYGKNVMNRPINGLVRVEEGIPQLIPMVLDRGGVWDGKVS
jgi:hypothetical protein